MRLTRGGRMSRPGSGGKIGLAVEIVLTVLDVIGRIVEGARRSRSPGEAGPSGQAELAGTNELRDSTEPAAQTGSEGTGEDKGLCVTIDNESGYERDNDNHR